HLRRLRARRGSGAIADFFAYVAAVAGNACNRYFRPRHLGRVRAPAAEAPEIDLDSLEAEPGGAETSIDRRRFAARLWAEIERLPRPQRVALLLHLRDHRGNSVLFLFPVCGVASLARIAMVLEISEKRLEEMWNELPADDNSLAELLGCKRQRVINL